MQHSVKIEFVSDVSCPWCAIALSALEEALKKLGPDIEAELNFEPFELNPQMSPGGEEIIEHLTRKYGAPKEHMIRAQESIRARGTEVGFAFDLDKRTRIYNTFDAHRLLHWAGAEGKQRALKHALFDAYFREGRDPSDRGVLLELAGRVGLDTERARQVLELEEYAGEVRAREQHYRDLGIEAVPSLIVNGRYLIQGGQPPQVFEQLLRRFAVEEAKAS